MTNFSYTIKSQTCQDETLPNGGEYLKRSDIDVPLGMTFLSIQVARVPFNDGFIPVTANICLITANRQTFSIGGLPFTCGRYPVTIKHVPFTGGCRTFCDDHHLSAVEGKINRACYIPFTAERQTFSDNCHMAPVEQQTFSNNKRLIIANYYTDNVNSRNGRSNTILNR
jgi:hypothetical protein